MDEAPIPPDEEHQEEPDRELDESLVVGTYPPATPPKVPSSGIPWGLAAFLVLALIVAIFAVQNPQDVEISFLVWDWRFPLAVVIIAVVAVSVILDEVLGALLRRRRRKRRAEKQELKQLRSRQP